MQLIFAKIDSLALEFTDCFLSQLCAELRAM